MRVWGPFTAVVEDTGRLVSWNTEDGKPLLTNQPGQFFRHNHKGKEIIDVMVVQRGSLHEYDSASHLRDLQAQIENAFTMLEYNGIPRVIPGLSGPPSLRSAIDRLATAKHRELQSKHEEFQTVLTICEHERNNVAQSREIIKDCHNLLEALAKILGVEHEPHETFEERLLDAATKAARREDGY